LSRNQLGGGVGRESRPPDHISSIFDKLEFSDRFGLAVFASRHGLAELPYDTKIPDAKWYTCTMWQKIVL